MANGVHLGIRYPFQDSKKGFFIDLTEDDDSEIKSDLLHLLLTNKGERLYNPNFGTNLLKFIFEPNDSLTLSDINRDIKDTVKLYFPSLTVNEVTVTPSPDSDYASVIKILYTITDSVFEKTDIITINV